MPIPTLFVGLILLLGSHLASFESAQGQDLTPSAYFTAAQNSFKAGDFKQALVHFKQAHKSGLHKPSLFYNIGVCSYKLGLYEEAKQAFLETATFPKMTALAYYNLAVVAEKQGDHATAISWLRKSLREARERDTKLILLAETALSRIRSSHEMITGWLRYGALDFGFDDNVSMVESEDQDLTSDEEDSFTDLFAFARTPLLGNSSSQGPFLQGNVSYRDYTDLNDYDVGSLRLEGLYRQKSRGFQVESGAGYSYVLWDGSGYSQGPIFTIQAKHPLGAVSSYRLRYDGQYFDILNVEYENLKGWSHRATAEFSAQLKSSNLILAYSLEENDRNEQQSSPRRHLISASLELYPAEHFSLTIASSYRASTYDEPDTSERNDDRFETSLLLSYTSTQKWGISGRFSHTNNSSTLPLYDYQKNMASISLNYSF